MSITLTDKKIDTVGGASITYNVGGNPSIGLSDPGRRIVIALSCTNPTGITNCLVNGNAATNLGTRFGNACASLWEITETAAGTAGLTSCSVQFNFAGSVIHSEIGVYSVITSNPAQTPGAANNALFISSSSISATLLNIPSDGGGIAVMAGDLNGSPNSTTWTGMTTDYDDNLGSNFTEGSAAHTVSNFGSVTFTANFSSSMNQSFIVAASWSGTQSGGTLMGQALM